MVSPSLTLSHLVSFCPSWSPLVPPGPSWSDLWSVLLRPPEETRLKLWNVSSSKNVLQLPSIFHHLPHLLNREDSLLPAVHVGQGRTGGKTQRTSETHTHTHAHTSSAAQGTEQK